MTDWLDTGETEIAILEQALKADPKTFKHKDGVPIRANGIDGDGAKRSLTISERLNGLVQRAGSLVVT